VLPIPAPRLQDEFNEPAGGGTPSRTAAWSIRASHVGAFREHAYAGAAGVCSVFPVAQGLALAAVQVHHGTSVVERMAQRGIDVRRAVFGCCKPGCRRVGHWLRPVGLRFGSASQLLDELLFRRRDCRDRRSPRVGSAAANPPLAFCAYPALMGLGIAILANSRPYEGFMLVLPALIAAQLCGSCEIGFACPRRLGSDAGGPGHCGSGHGGITSAAFTGNPAAVRIAFTGPPSTMAPHFIWPISAATAVYRHRVLRQFYAHGRWSATATRAPAVRARLVR